MALDTLESLWTPENIWEWLFITGGNLMPTDVCSCLGMTKNSSMRLFILRDVILVAISRRSPLIELTQFLK